MKAVREYDLAAFIKEKYIFKYEYIR